MFSKHKIILIGGGGHCKVVISILKELNIYNIIGISDVISEQGKEISGIRIDIKDEKLMSFRKKGVEYSLVTVGSIGNPEKRIKLFKDLKRIGFNLPKVISKNAIIAEDVIIEEGTVIMPGVIINPGTRIGKNCIINTGAIIDHDCSIGNHVHIAPGVVLSGGVRIDDNSHIATGTSIVQNINIGKDTIIGAGSIVLESFGDGVTAYGTPARIIRKKKEICI